MDLKAELFRNATKAWTLNAIHDIDALSLAVPYCHAVVPDKEMADLLARSRAAEDQDPDYWPSRLATRHVARSSKPGPVSWR